MYLTYDEYLNMGGTLDEATFNDFEYEAETQIDWYTFNRLHKDMKKFKAEHPESLYPSENLYPSEDLYPSDDKMYFPVAVTRCVYALIKLLQQKQQASMVGGVSLDGTVTAGISSQSNDGVSVSYNTVSARDCVELCGKEIEQCIRRYLQEVANSLGQKVLYRGVYPNE